MRHWCTFECVVHLCRWSIFSRVGDQLHVMRHYYISGERGPELLQQLLFRELLPIDGTLGYAPLPGGEHVRLWGTFCHFGVMRSGAIFGGVSNHLHLVRRWDLPKRRKLWLVFKLRFWHVLHGVGPLNCDDVTIRKLLFRWRIYFGFLRRRELRYHVCTDLYKLRRKQLFIDIGLK